jgi:uncharacterized protein (TIGR02118 family)
MLMVKVLTLINRKAGMPVDEFQDYWLTRHPLVVTRLPGVRRYVQSHVLPDTYRKREPVYDGMAEVWADDTDSLRAMTKSAAHPDLIADEARFIDRARMAIIVTDEHVAKEGPKEGVKAIELFTRNPETAIEAFQLHWRDVHAALAARVPGVRRYVASATRATAYAAGRTPSYDGAALMWFDSKEALAAAAGSPEYGALVADRTRFLAPGPPAFILTREHRILG